MQLCHDFARVTVRSVFRGLEIYVNVELMICAGLKLRVLVSSGEPLSQYLLSQLWAALPQETSVLNIYGSTEVAADVACYAAPRDVGVPIVGVTDPVETFKGRYHIRKSSTFISNQ